MKIQNKILALAISSVLSQAAIADGTCDSTDGVDAWGIWCSESEQPAPAAGPLSTPATDLQNIPADIGDSAGFGGQTEANPLSDALPITVATERVYYRAGYSLALNVKPLHKEGQNDERMTIFTPITGPISLSQPDVLASGIGTANLNPVDQNEASADFDELSTLWDAGDRISGSLADKDGNAIDSFDYTNSEALSEIESPYEALEYLEEEGTLSAAVVIKGGDEYINGYAGGSLSFTDYDEVEDGLEAEADISLVAAVEVPTSDGSPALRDYWNGAKVNARVELFSDDSVEIDADIHSFVGGALTPIDVVANQTVAATYQGYSSLHNQTVNIGVDFNNGTFEGDWTDGISYQTDQFTAVEVSDFHASGDLVGQHIVATSITGEGIIGGTLQGSFFGGGAEVLGGAYEVQTETNTFNDTFSTINDGSITHPVETALDVLNLDPT